MSEKHGNAVAVQILLELHRRDVSYKFFHLGYFWIATSEVECISEYLLLAHRFDKRKVRHDMKSESFSLFFLCGLSNALLNRATIPPAGFAQPAHLAAPLVLGGAVAAGVFGPGGGGRVPPHHVLEHSLPRQPGRETLPVEKLVQPEPDQNSRPRRQHCNNIPVTRILYILLIVMTGLACVVKHFINEWTFVVVAKYGF